MLRPQGYVTVVNAENGRTLERDTISCAHCNQIVMVKPGTGCTTYYIPQFIGPPKEEAGAWCAICNKPVCLTCHAHGRCTPLMLRIERMEATPLGKKVRRWFGLTVALLLVASAAVAQVRPSAPLNFQVIAGGVLGGVNTAVTITSPTSASTFDNGSTATVTLAGTATSDSVINVCTWTNSLGGSGTASGTGNWTIASLPLGIGSNVITVTCLNQGGGTPNTDVITVTRIDGVAPSVTITSPTSATTFDAGTSSALTSLGGTSSDNVSVSSVTWTNSLGGSGVASGTTSWTVASVPLTVGSNVITVTSIDPSGNMGTDVLTVTRSSSPVSGCGSAGCIYVDSACPTAGNGTIDTCGGATGRMTNLQTAITAATAGKVIVVHAGSGSYVSTAGAGYTGQAGFMFTSSGTASDPIVLRNATGERPVLRGCASTATTLAECNRPTITMFGQSYIQITSDNCPANIATQASLGLHVYGLVIAYDDGGATESTYAAGNQITCTEIERGYSSLGDGNWSAIWLQSQTGCTVSRNYLHDIEVETLTGEGSQSSRSGIKTYSAVNCTFASNTIVNVAYSSTNEYGLGFDCKADCVLDVFEKNLVLNTPTGWRIENQEQPGGPFTTNGATGTIVRYNLFTSDGSAGVRECWHFEDGKITTVTFHNNDCIGYNEGLGENNHPSTNVCQGITSYNNAFVETIDTNIKLSDGVGTSCTFALSNYNRFTTAAAAPRFRYNATNYTALADWQASGFGFDANSTEGTDASFLFTSAVTGDYTLQAASPLQSAGKVGGLSAGAAVDIGAYTDTVTILGCNCGVSTSTPLSSYYVRPDGSNSNLGTTNTAGGAWLTIDFAADHVAAGSTVRVQPGTYSERVTPAIDGTSTDPITFMADGVVTVCGWDLNNSDYLRIVGFVVDTNAGSCTINSGAIVLSGTNTFIELWNNVLRDALYNGVRTPGSFMNNSVIVGNVALNMGIFADPGSGTAFNVNGQNNFVCYNETSNIDPDAFSETGSDGILCNNYVHGMLELVSAHPDFLQNAQDTTAWSRNTVEGNIKIGAGTPNDHGTNLQSNVAWTQNVWRRNVFAALGSGGIGVPANTSGFTFFRYYNNTEATTCTDSSLSTEQGCFTLYGTGINNTYAFNNIHYQTWGSARTSSIFVYQVLNGTFTLDYNLAYDPDGTVSFTTPWTSQAHPRSNTNPNFVAPASDWHLAAGSGDGANARGTGGPLTTASGSGTGTTFNVATNGGGFFRGDNTSISQYSGALVKGDTICVGTDVVEIASIATDAITVTTSFTWANGDAVYFGDDCSPDLGAYPYKSGGYTLSATHTNSGGTVTTTPNDTSLVRFVICYSDGVPYAVDNASPYTCSAPTGNLTVWVYPLYASTTLRTASTLVP